MTSEGKLSMRVFKALASVFAAFLCLQALSAGELEIVKAEYGAEGTWKDVSAVLKEKLKDAQAFKAGNALFGDPIPGVEKKVSIVLRLDGKEQTLCAAEDTTLRLDKAAFEKLAKGESADAEDDEIGKIQSLVKNAAAKGLKKVEIPKGVHLLKCHDDTKWHLSFRKLKGIEIDATGSTFVLEVADKRGILFEDCIDVVFRGATIVHRQPPFSQGELLEISESRTSVDVKIHDGYPRDIDAGYKTPVLSIFDSSTGKLKRNVPDIGIKEVQPLGDGLLRFSLKWPLSKSVDIAKGDSIAWRCREGSEVAVNNCERLSFTGVTMKNHIGAAIVEHGGEGGNFYNYEITYADVPEGASKRPLLAGSADGFISFNARKGPTIDGCRFEGIHDDAVNINGVLALVVSSEEDGAVADYRANWKAAPFGKTGDPLEIFDAQARLIGEAKLLSFEKAPDVKPSEAFYKASGTRKYNGPEGATCIRVKFDRPVAVKPGGFIANRNRIGNGFAIRNCVVKNKRGHGFFIRAGDGVIENCTLENINFGGIVIAPEFRSFSEGSYAKNLVIRNNTLRRVGLATQSWNGAITVAGFEPGDDKWQFVPRPGGHRNILVENNRLESNDGPNMVISSVIGLTVRNNIFVNPMEGGSLHNGAGGLDSNALIWATESEQLLFEGNLVKNPGQNMKSVLKATPSASGAGFDSIQIEK